ncbi:heat shock protein HtpX [Bacteroides reticulotermitis]|nr:M48 family metallopeptidase [Bacteroides reticulotermitis]MBB4045597.1 heat shock protein HtpX [Bacteroides reticulotermitis]
MTYVGIHTQQSRNNTKTALLLLMFPALILLLVYLFFYVIAFQSTEEVQPHELALNGLLHTAPIVFGVVAVWFLIAYFFNTSMIQRATQAHTLERRDNKRVYNLVENLCMSQGMEMPKINVIEENSLNAFASGINKKSYTVTLTRGIIDTLDDAELEGVIAHELMHIRNRDVRLLIVSIVFVGIFMFIAEIAFRIAATSSWTRGRDKNNGGAIVVILLIALLGLVGYFFSILLRFAISRKREYMADAGAAEMTKQPQALASALRKISQRPKVESVEREDVAQLFIEHPAKGGIRGLFATHPPIEKRIAILEQF